MRRGKNKMRRDVVYVVKTKILLFQSLNPVALQDRSQNRILIS